MTSLTNRQCQGIEIEEVSDERLLDRVACGDSDALHTLYAQHGAVLFNYLVRLAGERMTAEEILQDTLLAIWRSAGTFRNTSSVRTWMFGVGRRQAHNRLRGQRLTTTELDEARYVAEQGPGPDTIALARLDLETLQDAMSRLTLLHREALELVFIDELSYLEVAQVLDVPVGTVKSRVSNARAALARQLKNVEG